MRINNNMMAMNTHRQLGMANTGGAKSMEKLSSGFRINRAGDDAAGLSISEKMRGQIRGLNQASTNAQDSISLIQTAEGALTESHAILQRMRELAVQSANDTNVDVDRGALQSEIDQLSQELTRISTDTEFNTQKLLNGKFEDRVFHIGANSDQNIKLGIANMDSKTLDVQGIVYKGETAISGITSIEVGSLTGEKMSIDIVAKQSGSTVTSGGGYAAIEKTTAEIIDGKIVITLAQEASVMSGNVVKTQGKVTATEADIKAALDSIASDAGIKVTVKSGSTLGETALTGAVTSGITGKELNVNDSNIDTEATKSAGIYISNQASADKAITTINDALGTVSAERSKLGAYQNRLEHTIKNLDNVSENLQASESRIRDVDMAKEMMEQTKQNILQQASTAMLAQANQAPQTVLSLLR